jgi:hypothetical protein
MKKKRFFLSITLLILTIGCLFIAINLHFDTEKLIKAIEKFQPMYLLGVLFAVSGQTMFQINRLWVLFPREAHVSWFHTARAFIYGQFINTFGYVGAGDVLKIVLARKNQDEQGRQIEAGESTALVLVVDKVVDVSSILLLGSLALLQTSFTIPQVNWAKNSHSLILGISLVGILLYLVFLLLRSYFPQFVKWFKAFQKGLNALRDPQRTLNGLLMGLGCWTCELLALQLLCIAQGFTLSYPQLMLVIILLNLGISVPVTLANIGTFEASMAFALYHVGVPKEISFAIAIVHHLFQLLEISLWSLVIWLYDRWNNGNELTFNLLKQGKEIEEDSRQKVSNK